jgi:hypothetical protein
MGHVQGLSYPGPKCCRTSGEELTGGDMTAVPNGPCSPVRRVVESAILVPTQRDHG